MMMMPVLPNKLVVLLFLALHPFAECQLQAKPPCRPIFVRWPRVRLNSHHVTVRSASLALTACRDACAGERDTGNALQCSAFNHRAGINAHGDECQLFRREHVQHTDGYVEADDQYTFYWKYCVDTEKSCTGDYAFTFLSDRYILASEVSRTKFTRSLEDCLAECLNGAGGAMLCRSVSFNRTDGGCHLSEQNQLSKPSAIRVNNNPNFRIDYYENNCYNNSFTFTSTCEPGGIRVRVDSRIPYTGALYGLYDFFSCRIEPRESKQFDYLFPYPHTSKNCSDSMRIMGHEALLEVVLSTDGVEPLYFITADDLTYQAKCPLPQHSSPSSPSTKWHYNSVGDESGDVPSSTKKGATVQSILEALSAAAEQPSIRRRFELGNDDHGTTMTTTSSSSSRRMDEEHRPSTDEKQQLFTKDMFTLLPLFTFGEVSSSASSTTTRPTESTTSSSSSTPTTTATTTTTTKAQEATVVVALQQGNAKMDLALVKGRRMGMEPIFDNKVEGSSKEGGGGTTAPAERHEDELEPEDNRSTAVSFLPTLSSSSSSSTGTTPSTTTQTETTSSSSTTMPAATTNSAAKSLSSSSAEFATSSSAERVRSTTKRAVEMDDGGGGWGTATAQRQSPTSAGREFSFSTHLAFPPDQIWLSSGANRAAAGQDHEGTTTASSTSSSSSTTTTPTTTTTATTTSSSTTNSPTATTTATTTTTSATTPSPPPAAAAHPSDATTTLPNPTTQSSTEAATTLRNNEFGGHPPGTSGGPGARRPPQQQDKVIFDIFHNGQPTEAVVVGSRITLAFTPYFAIPPAYMSISGCQVEPIGSLYDWEKEPLAIIKDGCQADHVGLVCPPQKTDYGIRVTVESFRYQTTTQVQYTCLVRICPFAPCPQTTCPPVDGCPGDDIVSRTLGLNSRARRSASAAATDSSGTPELTLEQIRAALIANPLLQRQLGGLLAQPLQSQQSSPSGVVASPPSSPPASSSSAQQQHLLSSSHQSSQHRRFPDAPVLGAAPTLRMNTALQQQLIVLGGDTIVRRRLVVVNSEEELRYYVKTGEVPRPAGA